jgi:hypothetical protein
VTNYDNNWVTIISRRADFPRVDSGPALWIVRTTKNLRNKV